MARGSVHLRKVVQVLVLAVPILAAFAAVIFGLACLLAWLHGCAITDGSNLILACLCSLITGLFLIVFHASRETINVPFRNRQTFLSACRLVLKELGYEVVAKSRAQLVSRPSFRALLFGGRIQVNVFDDTARITGPKVFLEILRSRLRLCTLIANVEQSFKEMQQRQGERLLKRIQVNLRLTREQWVEVGREVMEHLAGEGAEVFCAVQIMAQSEGGIRESLIDGDLRAWLKQRAIPAEILKDHVRWDEPCGPEIVKGAAETEVHIDLVSAKV
jgi:hypothetical protein